MSITPLSDPDEPLKRFDLVLDRYRVEERLAAGGHSIVYRGFDERLERPVCIKAFHGLTEDLGIRATVLEHFVQEAFALSKLSHPNTLRIYDFGHLPSAGGNIAVPVQVSEYMGGGTLGSIVRAEGPLASDDALTIICKLGDALSEAHRNGIVHRDIKPQNILFTGGEGREPKLADFGIAKLALVGNPHNRANETHVTAGFPLAMYSRSWAASEQLSGNETSPAADIFSLALVAIYSLTGKAICAAPTAREGYELRRTLAGTIDETLAGYGLSPELVSVMQHACAFEPAERPRSADAFVKALRHAHAKPLPIIIETHSSSRSNATPPGTAALHLLRKPEHWPDHGAARSEEAKLLSAEGTETTGIVDVDSEARRSATPPQPPPAKVQLALQARPSQPAPIIALHRDQPHQLIGTRTCNFIELREASVTLHIGATQVLLSTTPNPLSASGQTITIKGITSFVAKAGGRPSRAVIISADEYIDLIDPRKRLLGRIRVSFGLREAGAHHFQLGNHHVVVDPVECPNPVVIDSPTHHQSFLLYGVGQTTPVRVSQR